MGDKYYVRQSIKSIRYYCMDLAVLGCLCSL